LFRTKRGGVFNVAGQVLVKTFVNYYNCTVLEREEGRLWGVAKKRFFTNVRRKDCSLLSALVLKKKGGEV